MKATELRIGNSILINGEIVKEIGYGVITDFYQQRKGIKNPYLNTLKFEPIQLTEDWLIKFGFYLHENRPRPIYGNNSFIFIYKQDGIFWSDLMHGTMEIKSVHQLQNLFFALTGEELKLRPTAA